MVLIYGIHRHNDAHIEKIAIKNAQVTLTIIEFNRKFEVITRIAGLLSICRVSQSLVARE